MQLEWFQEYLITRKVLDARRPKSLEVRRTDKYAATKRDDPSSAVALLRRMEGNAADDALMVNQGPLFRLTLITKSFIFPSIKGTSFHLTHQMS